MNTIRNSLFTLSMLFAFISVMEFVFAQIADIEKQESKMEQNNQLKTYTGFELLSLHDIGTEMKNRILYVSNKEISKLAIQMKNGFIVRAVYDDSPADKEGLQSDDIIVSFNGMRFVSLNVYEQWIKNNTNSKIALIVYKWSDRYQKSKIIIITPAAEKPADLKIKKTKTSIEYETKYKTFAQMLEERIKNAKTVPLFEGSSIKEFQEAEKVFGKETIYSSNLPEPYTANTNIKLYEYNGKTNSVLLDGNKLIVIEKDILNNINTIVTSEDPKNRESVLKKLLQEKDRYNDKKLIEKELLTIRIKNAKTEPLFEGSSIKKVPDILEIYKSRNFSFAFSFAPYHVDNDIKLHLDENEIKNYTTVLDENTVIFILQIKLDSILNTINVLDLNNILKDKTFRYLLNMAKLREKSDKYSNESSASSNNFDAIITFLKLIQKSDAEFILTYLMSCNLSVNEDILSLTDSSSETVSLQISINTAQKTVSGLLKLSPQNMSTVDSFRILDDNNLDFQSEKLEFELNQKIATDIINAVIINKGCCIRFHSHSKKNDITISDQCSKTMKCSYDCFKRIEQTMKQK
jgi:hypothetical protein